MATTFQRQGKRSQTPRRCRTKYRLLQQRLVCSTITFSHAPNQLGLQPSEHPKDREVAESKLGWAAGHRHPPVPHGASRRVGISGGHEGGLVPLLVLQHDVVTPKTHHPGHVRALEAGSGPGHELDRKERPHPSVGA